MPVCHAQVQNRLVSAAELGVSVMCANAPQKTVQANVLIARGHAHASTIASNLVSDVPVCPMSSLRA